MAQLGFSDQATGVEQAAFVLLFLVPPVGYAALLITQRVRLGRPFSVCDIVIVASATFIWLSVALIPSGLTSSALIAAMSVFYLPLTAFQDEARSHSSYRVIVLNRHLVIILCGIVGASVSIFATEYLLQDYVYTTSDAAGRFGYLNAPLVMAYAISAISIVINSRTESGMGVLSGVIGEMPSDESVEITGYGIVAIGLFFYLVVMPVL